MIALIVGTMVTMYTSCLLASLHRHDGRRYTRYRDLAYSIVGANLFPPLPNLTCLSLLRLSSDRDGKWALAALDAARPGEFWGLWSWL